MLKYGCVSCVYAVMVHMLNGKLGEMLEAVDGSFESGVVDVVTVLAFVIPVICFAGNALKINNLYNVRRFFLRAWKKHALSIGAFAGILIYEAVKMPMFSGYMVGAFVISLMWLGREYNLPLTGNER